MSTKKTYTPGQIFDEFRAGSSYKESIGDKGIREQAKINERFYVGDQWHGVNCSNERPLVRHNFIKRIGDYKNSILTAADIAVNYSAEGVPNNKDADKEKAVLEEMQQDDYSAPAKADYIEISAITKAMSDYFRTTAERLRFDRFKEQVARNAFISGTGILYTYWDGAIDTGLYADKEQTSKIKGDIAIEILDVENVVFGDPNDTEIQSQPYIDVAQRRNIEAVKREAKLNGQSTDNIKPDKSDTAPGSGARSDEPENSKRVTVITRFFKEYSDDGKSFRVKAIRVTETAVIRDTWDLEIKCYPFAVYQWEPRRSSVYGDSEITYLIPNQIAVNRILTAAVWGMMSAGMPIMVVNGDMITDEITNAPGQVFKVYGDAQNAIYYVRPPEISGLYNTLVKDLLDNTLSMAGATDSALGNYRPDNAAAIIQMKEAAQRPMQMYVNRFYDFVEQVARIWADFWFNLYGDRALKITDSDGTNYVPFSADRYKELVITARIDVGNSAMWSVPIQQSYLDSLFSNKVITALQYLESLPQGILPNIGRIIEEQKAAQGQMKEDEAMLQDLQRRYPAQYATIMKMSPEQRQAYLRDARNGGKTEDDSEGVI